jgi:hypothetical protein
VQKGSCRGSRVCFYRARRGGGATAEVMAINAMAAPAVLMTFKRGCLKADGN